MLIWSNLHRAAACIALCFSHPGSSHAAVSASDSNNGRLGEPSDLSLAVDLCRVATAKCADAKVGGRTDM